MSSVTNRIKSCSHFCFPLREVLMDIKNNKIEQLGLHTLAFNSGVYVYLKIYLMIIKDLLNCSACY